MTNKSFSHVQHVDMLRSLDKSLRTDNKSFIVLKNPNHNNRQSLIRNVRSSILGEGGRAKEAQTEFLTLMEDAIRQTDLAKSVQRYQLAVDQAKVRLNLAVCPGAWLMPARMIINTESIVGYNNKLKQAKSGMKLGINNDVNLGTKEAGLMSMDGGPSKINPPNSHPSNPIHKAATHDKQTSEKETVLEKPPNKTPQHEINKTAVIIGVVGVVAMLFIAAR